MRRVATSVAAVLTAITLTSCGSDESDDDTTAPTPDDSTSAAAETCAESFNAGAPVAFARIVRLSHADGAPILTGRYAGEAFTAEAYDDTTDGTGAEATVEPGACVVTEPSDLGTLYVFAVADDGTWRRFLESDPVVPLATDPASRLEDVVETTLAEGQTSDSPDLVPIGS